MNCTRLIPLLFLVSIPVTQAQTPEADTVIVPLAETSKVIFTIEDHSDIETLRHYDFQKLFDDIFDRLDTATTDVPARDNDVRVDTRDEEKDIENTDGHRSRTVGHTRRSFNVDVGLNNYLADGQFPTGNELHAVRPWGSWYIAGNSLHRTRLGRRAYVELGLGVSWYSFKFEQDNVVLFDEPGGVVFDTDSRDVNFIKSKLSATFINASMVPVLDFGEHTRKGKGDGFRLGIGPYVGYRLSSKTKLVYEEGKDREREKTRDNFHLNNLRYGLRLQVGIKSTDIFINYDLNELFATDMGPKLNAVSFGFIL